MRPIPTAFSNHAGSVAAASLEHCRHEPHRQRFAGRAVPGSALPLGRKTAAPNRFVFAAHQTNFATHNRFTERHAAYYEARAAGGVGVIVLEGSVVHPSDWPYEYAMFGYDAAVVDGYRRWRRRCIATGLWRWRT